MEARATSKTESFVTMSVAPVLAGLTARTWPQWPPRVCWTLKNIRGKRIASDTKPGPMTTLRKTYAQASDSRSPMSPRPPEEFYRNVLAVGAEPSYMKCVFDSYTDYTAGKIQDSDEVFDNFPAITGGFCKNARGEVQVLNQLGQEPNSNGISKWTKPINRPPSLALLSTTRSSRPWLCPPGRPNRSTKSSTASMPSINSRRKSIS